MIDNGMEKGSDGKDQRKRERWEGGVIIKGMEKGREREGEREVREGEREVWEGGNDRKEWRKGVIV